jgi:hypothetical protein
MTDLVVMNAMMLSFTLPMHACVSQYVILQSFAVRYSAGSERLDMAADRVGFPVRAARLLPRDGCFAGGGCQVPGRVCF